MGRTNTGFRLDRKRSAKEKGGIQPELSPEGICAIIPSAGFSSRMGRFKPLLSLGKETVLERQVSLFRSVGITDIRVVTGHRAEEICGLLGRLGVREIRNEQYAEGMFSSVRAGMESLRKRPKSFFFLPVDIPLIRTATIRRMINTGPLAEREIRYPDFLFHRGHPPLISGKWVEEIAAYHGEGGLRGFLNGCGNDATDVPVFDEGSLQDMDTPEKYAAAVRRISFLKVPTLRECEALLDFYLAPYPNIIAHCEKVADVAICIAAALKAKDVPVSIQKVRAAGLLHDVLRTRPKHAREGAALMKKLGFDAIAPLVEEHMNLKNHTEGFPGEKEIIYLSDKMTDGHRLVSLEERFRSRLESHACSKQMIEGIQRRLSDAIRIKKRVEKVIGVSLDEVLGARAKITSHFQRPSISLSGVAKIRNMPDIP